MANEWRGAWRRRDALNPKSRFAAGSVGRVWSRSSWVLPEVRPLASVSVLIPTSRSFRAAIAVIGSRELLGRVASAPSKRFSSIFSTVVGRVPGS